MNQQPLQIFLLFSLICLKINITLSEKGMLVSDKPFSINSSWGMEVLRRRPGMLLSIQPCDAENTYLIVNSLLAYLIVLFSRQYVVCIDWVCRSSSSKISNCLWLQSDPQEINLEALCHMFCKDGCHINCFTIYNRSSCDLWTAEASIPPQGPLWYNIFLQ